MKIRFRDEEALESGYAGPDFAGSGRAERLPQRPVPQREPAPALSWAPDARRGGDPLSIAPYDALSSGLWLRSADGAPRITLFVGASPGCGTSTVAAGFARSLCDRAGARVLLLDFDPRRPARAAGQASFPDLAYWLDANAPRHRDASEEGSPEPLRIGLGSMPPALLHGEAFDEFLQAARERFDQVIVDAPALQNHPESLVLSRKADRVVLVVESRATRKQSALWAKQELIHARANLVGVVLNRRRFYVPHWLYERL